MELLHLFYRWETEFAVNIHNAYRHSFEDLGQERYASVLMLARGIIRSLQAVLFQFHC